MCSRTGSPICWPRGTWRRMRSWLSPSPTRRPARWRAGWLPWSARGPGRMWVMTFHSACVRILRREARRFGYPSSFSIYDQADSQRLMALVCRELELDPKQFPPKAMAAQVVEPEERADRPRDLRRAGARRQEKALAEAYGEYQRRLFAAGAMDFDDLIMVTVNLFQAIPEVRRAIPSPVPARAGGRVPGHQPCPVPLAASCCAGEPPQPRCVVGDADQSIYAFRGADITQHPRVRAGLPGRHGHPAGAELPFHPEHPGRRQRGGLAATGDGSRRTCGRQGAGPTDRRLRGRQRARRGRIRGRGGGPAHRRGPGHPGPGRRLLPDERAVPCLRGSVHPGRAAVPGRRRGPVLRAARGPRSARLPAADRQPGR